MLPGRHPRLPGCARKHRPASTADSAMPFQRVGAVGRLLPCPYPEPALSVAMGSSQQSCCVLLRSDHLRTGQQLRHDGLLQGAFQSTGRLCSTAVGAGGSPWGGSGKCCRADFDVDCRTVMLHVASIPNLMRAIHCCHHLLRCAKARSDCVARPGSGCVCIQCQVASTISQ